MRSAEPAPVSCTLNRGEFSTTAREGACGCAAPRAPTDRVTDRVMGASAALAATGALVCGVCCVLPFALPAAVLAVSGGVIGWFAKATPWAMRVALLAVLSGWAWVAVESVRTRRRPAGSTLLTLGLATGVFVAAMTWWHFEREIVHLLR